MVVVRKIQGAYREFNSWPRKAQLPIYAALGYFAIIAMKYL